MGKFLHSISTFSKNNQQARRFSAKEIQNNILLRIVELSHSQAEKCGSVFGLSVCVSITLTFVSNRHQQRNYMQTITYKRSRKRRKYHVYFIYIETTAKRCSLYNCTCPVCLFMMRYLSSVYLCTCRLCVCGSSTFCHRLCCDLCDFFVLFFLCYVHLVLHFV